MSLLQIGEVFGFSSHKINSNNLGLLKPKVCPFKDTPCRKGGAQDPLGICSFGDVSQAVTVCPNRFLESNRLFSDAATMAFGNGVRFSINSEIRILKIEKSGKNQKIGKVDFVLGKLNQSNEVVDFCAIEVQSVYISGKTIRPAFHRFLKTAVLDDKSRSRPDYRSSIQKRLMPQLAIKVPVFRRWGKKFFVAIDKSFYNHIPSFEKETSISNSEITWLVYPFSLSSEGDYNMGDPDVHYSSWDKVSTALNEGKAPTPEEILEELNKKLRKAIVLSVPQK